MFILELSLTADEEFAIKEPKLHQVYQGTKQL